MIALPLRALDIAIASAYGRPPPGMSSTASPCPAPHQIGDISLPTDRPSPSARAPPSSWPKDDQRLLSARGPSRSTQHLWPAGGPLLSYELRSPPPASFERVQESLSAFDGITKPLSQFEAVQDRDPASPRRWGFAGEVMRHAVTVSGDVAAGGRVFGPGAGTADVIRVGVSADRLVAF